MRLSRAWIGGVAQKVVGLAECPLPVCASPNAAEVLVK
jgi:nucleotide-binding universal stress UspA family protein